MKREELADLTVFLAVAEQGSFTRAAAHLGISQSAVSHTMRRLEASLGFRLLNRNSRSVSTTEMGDKLLASLRPNLGQIENRIEELRSLRGTPSGLVRITTSATAARTILWPVIRDLVRDYPDIQIEVNTNPALSDLAEGRFDCALRLAEGVPPDMIAVPVTGPLQMAAVGSPAYFAARGVPLHPRDLDGHACLNMRFGPNAPIYDWEFEKAGETLVRKVNGPFTFNDADFCVQAAREGYGIAFVGLPEVQPDLDTGKLQRVLADWCDPFEGFHLCYSSRRQMSSAFRLLVDRLRHRPT
ncbi:LysR family transcriptional regulator [Donghicola sp. C2-DW-16]|uniref:LysR family transcriptional regulator n=1 Tax=Donghicola mangrovi TaxID=2729614 RepID=A0ABX2PH87_9RHOB|nr:LysR family transcriptional regulator [Donghicola mangrovi]NVO27949.1 LysR family transcriptional regulator [Donghicola mangrovi]